MGDAGFQFGNAAFILGLCPGQLRAVAVSSVCAAESIGILLIFCLFFCEGSLLGVVFRLFCGKFLLSGSDLIFGRCDLRLCRIQLCLCAGKLCFAVRQLLFRVFQLFLVLVNLLLGIADLAVQFRLVVLNLLFSILDLRFGIVQFGLGVIQFRFRLGDLLSAVVNLFLILRPNGIKPLCRASSSRVSSWFLCACILSVYASE